MTAPLRVAGALLTARRKLTALLVALVALTTLASDAAAQGFLLPTDAGVAPLELRQHEVDFRVQDAAAVTHVTQVFANHTAQMLEATYYFAVPEGSVTTDFALWMNGERISGEVLPRDQARGIYEGIVARMRDPGLLEYVDGELFQARIFPIPPHGEQRVEIEFASTLPDDGQTLHYRYPLHESAGRIGQLVVSGSVESRHPIARVYAPYHAIEDIESRNGARRISMEQTGARAEEDFELFITRTGQDLGFSLLTHDPGGGEDGYFMMTLSPSPELQELEVLPKQVTFVVDTSGSMSGAKIRQAREFLTYCIEHLGEDDTFQVITFSGAVRAAFDEPMRATRANVADALAFVDALEARGNTNISGALDRALRDPAAADRPHAVLFVTDGLPTAGETSIDHILSEVHRGVSDGDRRLFAFGVGYDVNTRLLDGMARRGRGETGYVRPNEDMSDVIGTFYDGINAPLLTRLAFDFGGVEVRNVYPNPLPDLYRDREVTVFGRFDANRSSAVVVRGQAGSREIVMEHGATFASTSTVDTRFVGNLWASRRVAALLDEIDEEGETQARRDRVVALATEWGIVTPYTSYLAVEPGMHEQALSRRDTSPPPPAEAMAPRRSTGVDLDDELGLQGVGSSSGRAFGTTGVGRGGGGMAAPSAEPVGGARRPNAPPTAATTRSRASRQPRAQSGAEAVEESIARNEDRERMVVEETRAATQRASGRAFAAHAGLWVESGLEQVTPDQVVIAMSEAYFTLLREHPELRDVFALGERVRFRLGQRVIEVRP